MSRVGARRERERAVPRAPGVPRLAKPARQARYARVAPWSVGVCHRPSSRPSRPRKREEPAQVAGGCHEVPLAPDIRPTAELAAAKPHRLLDLRAGPLALRLAARVPPPRPQEAEQSVHALCLDALRPARALPLAPARDQAALALRPQRREIRLAEIPLVEEGAA